MVVSVAGKSPWARAWTAQPIGFSYPRSVCDTKALMQLRYAACGAIYMWLGRVVVRALDLRLEIAGSIPAAALSSATLDKLFTHIVQRL